MSSAEGPSTADATVSAAHDAVTAATTAAPVSADERIASLDVLRGFAILGILIMNIQSFSMISAAYLNPTAYGDLTGLNRVVWVLSHLFADMKFISIFSMLFGAGIVLFATRLESRGIRPGPLHYRRTFWLLVIGLSHGFLLWYGDVLAIYSLVAFVAYLFWRRSPTALFVTGVALMSVTTLLYLVSGYTIQFAPPEALDGIRAFWSPGAEVVAHEVAALRGSWGEQMSVRVPEMVSTLTVVLFMYYLWRTIGMMLIGMALFKWGVLSAERSKRFYGTVAVVGLAVGLPLIGLGIVRRFADGWSVPWSFFAGSQVQLLGQRIRRHGLRVGHHAHSQSRRSGQDAAGAGRGRPDGLHELPDADRHLHHPFLRPRVRPLWERPAQRADTDRVRRLGVPVMVLYPLARAVPVRSRGVAVADADLSQTAAYEAMMQRGFSWRGTRRRYSTGFCPLRSRTRS